MSGNSRHLGWPLKGVPLYNKIELKATRLCHGRKWRQLAGEIHNWNTKSLGVRPNSNIIRWPIIFFPIPLPLFSPTTSHWTRHPGEPWVRFRELITYWKTVESWVERSRAITYGIIWGVDGSGGRGVATAKINRHNSMGCTLQKWKRECVRTEQKLKKGGGELLNAHPELFV